MVVGTSGDVDWQLAAAALAAASRSRVAMLVVGEAPAPSPMLAGQVATWLSLRPGDGADLTGVVEVVRLVATLRATHGLVLVAAPPGLLVPLGRDDWTLADLATALPARAVVVTSAGAEASNHTTLTLGALAGHGIPAAVITVGAEDDVDWLPVTPAGHIPADRPDDFAAAAPGWLDPILHATSGRAKTRKPPKPQTPKPQDPQPQAGVRAESPGPHDQSPASSGDTDRGNEAHGQAAPAGQAADTPSPVSLGQARTGGGLRRPGGEPAARTVSGRRVVLVLVAVFAVAAFVACGLAFVNRATPERERQSGTTFGQKSAGVQMVPMPSRAVVPRATRPASAVCPEYFAEVIPARPDRATQARVGAAWKRIESWLAGHAPKTRRALRPPTSQAAIDQMQARMSVAFPPDLVVSLRRHDGVGGLESVLPPFYAPAPLTRIHSEWARNCGVMANVGNLGVWWDKAFIPFATAGDGGCLVLDQRDGGHGRVGEYFAENGTAFERWPASVTEYLEKTAAALESGHPYDGHYRPKVTDGVLDWDIV